MILVGDAVGISASFKFAAKSIFLAGLLARKKLSAHFVVEWSLTIFGRSRYMS